MENRMLLEFQPIRCLRQHQPTVCWCMAITILSLVVLPVTSWLHLKLNAHPSRCWDQYLIYYDVVHHICIRSTVWGDHAITMCIRYTTPVCPRYMALFSSISQYVSLYDTFISGTLVRYDYNILYSALCKCISCLGRVSAHTFVCRVINFLLNSIFSFYVIQYILFLNHIA